MSKPDHCPECGAILSDPAEQSDAARRRFFAIMRDAHGNMPDQWRTLLPSPEHLRKFVLCRVGYCESTVTSCGNKKAAQEVAALAQRLDTFAVVDVSGSIVTVATARSMRKRACPKATFMPLTEKAYAYLNKMTGYDVEHSEFRAAHDHQQSALGQRREKRDGVSSWNEGDAD